MGIRNSFPLNPNFWPKNKIPFVWGEHIFQGFIDQAIAQWNSALVRRLFLPHITNSAIKNSPSRLGIANKLISLHDSMNLSFFFKVKWIYLPSPWWLPFKVLAFLWKLSNDNLPVRREFTKGNFINNASCQLCATNEEALDYLLITYELHSQFRIGLLFGWIVYKAQDMYHCFNFIFSSTLWPIGSIETKWCMKQ